MTRPTSARDASFDYLRAFVVLLVLLHHSMLAYAAMWPAQPRTFTTPPAPLVDAQRWVGFDALAVFNDTFFMALLFLLSGLFAWPSLQRKGAGRFLRDRLLRLGVPFVVAVGILMPIAYYPAYAVTGADPGFSAYARAWLSLGYWPSGPAWFISMLFVFDALAAGLHALRRRASAKAAAWKNPLVFAGLLFVVSVLVYTPMDLAFGADRWFTIGAFSFQASRLFLYATWFFAGLGLGAAGLESGPLARDGGLPRHWPIWLLAAAIAYGLRLAVIVALMLPVAMAHRPLPLGTRLLSSVTVMLCCVTISFAFIALFRRFAVARRPLLDSLSASSYGLYLIHYPIVVWLQFALLALALGPIAKGTLVFVGTVALSWGSVVALRRVPVIARVL
jgi:peptidoglycan/LPS O-acetylase OafA/YrhL